MLFSYKAVNTFSWHHDVSRGQADDRERLVATKRHGLIATAQLYIDVGLVYFGVEGTRLQAINI